MQKIRLLSNLDLNYSRAYQKVSEYGTLSHSLCPFGNGNDPYVGKRLEEGLELIGKTGIYKQNHIDDICVHMGLYAPWDSSPRQMNGFFNSTFSFKVSKPGFTDAGQVGLIFKKELLPYLIENIKWEKSLEGPFLGQLSVLLWQYAANINNPYQIIVDKLLSDLRSINKMNSNRLTEYGFHCSIYNIPAEFIDSIVFTPKLNLVI